MTGSKQLPLPLPAREALGREDFFVSEANAMAVALVERWSEWPGAKMVICGPRGSGKTHLAHVWAKLSGARIVGADTLAEAEIPDLASGPVCVEDVPQIAGDRPAEEALFHLHNLVLAQGHSLLMTAEREPTLWPLVLPDLKSRIMGAQVARMGAPDDALLTALLAKQFADRQITPVVSHPAHAAQPRRCPGGGGGAGRGVAGAQEAGHTGYGCRGAGAHGRHGRQRHRLSPPAGKTVVCSGLRPRLRAGKTVDNRRRGSLRHCHQSVAEPEA